MADPRGPGDGGPALPPPVDAGPGPAPRPVPVRRPWRLGLGAAALVLVLDQLSKVWILTQVMTPPRVIELAPFANLVLVWNTGVSFGIMNDQGAWNAWILSGVSLAITAGLMVWLRRAENRFQGLLLGLVIGGALGNMVDRLRHGAVTDFIDLHGFGYHWPAFNVADAAISTGAVLLIGETLFGRSGSGGAPRGR
ncbi:signal peptidase II [Pararhodospirillum oryzae]|uniref:Lipoprotein signal peptidase n=1 Tax=Pararhodospirillum oryzae TaxID=478448 RepID=A0A512H8F0_9PROT|nr:signal peptidase II [Pararhodospirillum oryzae]GEO81735.1 hypothetical protein ROR02_18660 [Pararhodospirillum oryzae]